MATAVRIDSGTADSVIAPSLITGPTKDGVGELGVPEASPASQRAA